MILGTSDNTPIAAPQINDANSMLSDFRDFMRNINLTKDDLYAFLTNPGPRRDEFLQKFESEQEIVSHRFVTVTYL